MPRKRKSLILFLGIGFLLFLVLSFSGDEGAIDAEGKLEAPLTGLDAVRQAFKNMDRHLDEVIKWYDEVTRDGTFTPEDSTRLREYIVLLKTDKVAALRGMPTPYGVSMPFDLWYHSFKFIDDALDRLEGNLNELVGAAAWRLEHEKEELETAKREKKQMEGWLPQEAAP